MPRWLWSPSQWFEVTVPRTAPALGAELDAMRPDAEMQRLASSGAERAGGLARGRQDDWNATCSRWFSTRIASRAPSWTTRL